MGEFSQGGNAGRSVLNFLTSGESHGACLIAIFDLAAVVGEAMTTFELTRFYEVAPHG